MCPRSRWGGRLQTQEVRGQPLLRGLPDPGSSSRAPRSPGVGVVQASASGGGCGLGVEVQPAAERNHTAQQHADQGKGVRGQG